jgi:hypothetical protein
MILRPFNAVDIGTYRRKLTTGASKLRTGDYFHSSTNLISINDVLFSVISMNSENALVSKGLGVVNRCNSGNDHRTMVLWISDIALRFASIA